MALFERIKRYGPVGESLPFGVGFEVSKSPFQAQSVFLLLADPEIELSAISADEPPRLNL